MALISVIVPVYRVEPYLKRCIDSILGQTFTDLELVLVNDGSPDNCGKICDEYAMKDQRVHVIHQENEGLSAARNTGIDWVINFSDSKWITFVDSDDWIHPSMLEILYNTATDSNVAISVCDYYLSNGKEAQIDLKNIKYEKRDVEEAYSLRGGLIDLACGKLFLRELFQSIRFPKGKLFEDAWTTYKVVFQEKEITMIYEKLYFYYVNENSISRSSWSPEWLTEVEAHEEQIEFFNSNHYNIALKEALNVFFWVLYRQQENMKKNLIYTKEYEKELFSKCKKNLKRYSAIIERNKYKDVFEWCHPKYSMIKGIQRSLNRKTRNLCKKSYYKIRNCVEASYQKLVGTRIRENKFNDLVNLASRISIENAKDNVENFYYTKSPMFSQHTVIKSEYDLMIIVPVYNVEKYLEQCIQSILNQQTKYTYKVVFVNDGSSDASGNILEKYRNKSNVKVITQENRGHSGARNRALKNIEANYVMFVDSDDFISNSAIEALLSTAYKLDADVIEGAHQYYSDTREYNAVFSVSKEEIVHPRKLTGYPWGKVIRSKYFLNNCFPEGLWYEDTIMATLIYPECSILGAIPDIVYFYRQNPHGISATGRLNKKCVDTYWITKYYLEEKQRRKHVFGMYEYEQFLLQLKKNQIRLEKMPITIQESVFVLSCELHEKFFGDIEIPKDKIYQRLVHTLKCNSFKAYIFLIDNWDKFM